MTYEQPDEALVPGQAGLLSASGQSIVGGLSARRGPARPRRRPVGGRAPLSATPASHHRVHLARGGSSGRQRHANDSGISGAPLDSERHVVLGRLRPECRRARRVRARAPTVTRPRVGSLSAGVDEPCVGRTDAPRALGRRLLLSVARRFPTQRVRPIRFTRSWNRGSARNESKPGRSSTPGLNRSLTPRSSHAIAWFLSPSAV